MSFDSWLSITTSMFGLCAGIFFARGIYKLDKQTIKLISSACIQSNPYLEKSLLYQKYDYMMGCYLIILTFILQIISKLLSFSILSFKLTFYLNILLVFEMGVILSFLFVLSSWLRDSIDKSLKKELQ